jgi:hypothetical protein
LRAAIKTPALGEKRAPPTPKEYKNNNIIIMV